MAGKGELRNVSTAADIARNEVRIRVHDEGTSKLLKELLDKHDAVVHYCQALLGDDADGGEYGAGVRGACTDVLRIMGALDDPEEVQG